MNDYAGRWLLDEIGSLDETAFTTTASVPGSDSYTVALWFKANRSTGKQVLVNQGNQTPTQAGWSLFLEAGKLHFQVRFAHGSMVETSCELPISGRWQHVAGVLDRQQGQLLLYLNGSVMDTAALPAEPIAPETALLLGGYTDPAGGHFDHTFGRGDSGLLDDCRIYQRALTPLEITALLPAASPPPDADFSILPDGGNAPLKVRFEGRVTQARAYLWDYGDGTRGIGAVTEHGFRYAGTYIIRLTVIGTDYSEATHEQTLTLQGAANPLQIRPVFVNGTEGYACYRIPAIVQAANGDLLAFAEGRVSSCSDSSRPIRLVCKRSRDNGQTWEPLQVIAQNGSGDAEYMIHNPSPVVDTVRGTGRVLVLYNKAEHTEWDLARGIGVSRICCRISDDHGYTWQPERDLTAELHRPYNPDYAHICPTAAAEENRAHDWRIQRPTLGHALQLRGPLASGRLLFAGVLTQGACSVFASQNYVFWSDDLGASWQIGGVISQIGLNEATALELENGDILINSRGYQQEQPMGRRALTLGHFMDAETLDFIALGPADALIDPAVQASSIRYTHSADAGTGGKSRLLFANPNHPQARVNLMVRLSYDEGQSWPIARTIDPGPAAYSDLVIQADQRIGLLYERGNQGGIAYVDFTLDWLTAGQDQLSPQ